MKDFKVILLLLFAAFSLEGQEERKYFFESNAHFGQIIVHKEEIIFKAPKLTSGIDFSIGKSTNGNKDWHHAHQFPQVGLNFLAMNLGNQDTLGQAYAMFPFLSVPIIARPKFSIYFTGGTGIAYLSKPNDKISNPNNNAIGSHINNTTVFRFKSQYAVGKNLNFNLGLGFTHFSNGLAKSPNFGINIVTGLVGLQYNPNREDRFSLVREKPTLKSKKLYFDLAYMMATREASTSGGPNYPVRIFNLGMAYRLSVGNQLLFGFNYEYHPSVYFFTLHTFAFDTEAEARVAATRYMLYAGDELLFGNVGVSGLLSFYISPKSYNLPKAYNFKLSFRYFFKPLRSSDAKIFAGITLKTHLVVAEYIGLRAGFYF